MATLPILPAILVATTNYFAKDETLEALKRLLNQTS
jgi:hypothetical protein